MTDGLPLPLTPPDCDLRGYDFMPLYGHRLFTSDLYTSSTDTEFRAALRLWWSAWQQCPAGSLPDNDSALAMMSDYGRDIKGWRQIKEKALHGFVRCSDGRLYHPMLCEEAVKAFALRLKSDAKREADRERLNQWRQRRSMSEGKWEEVRGRVFTRDGYKCQTCNSNDDLHCDHIISLADGGDNSEANLVTLCRACHSRKTAIHDIPSRRRRKPSPDGDEMHFTEHSEAHVGTANVAVDKTTQDNTKKEREREARAQAPAARPRQAKIHSDWFPDADGIECAKEAGIPDVVETIGQFVDYYTANGKPMADWGAAWRVWCRREPELRRNGK